MRCFACGGRAVQRHHVVPKGRLKALHRTLSAAYRRGQGPRPWTKTKVLADERNLLPVCLDCHGQIEGASDMHVELAQVPAGFWSFVSEYQLTGELPRSLTEALAEEWTF
jgi:hypothetical protein